MADDKVIGITFKDIIALVCAILTTIGVFLAWETATIVGTTSDFTGIDIYELGRDLGADLSTFYFAPIIALVTGIAAAIVTILPFLSVTGNNSEQSMKIANIIVLFLYIATVVSAYIYGGPDVLLDYDSDYSEVIESMGIGFWFVIAFGFIGMIITLLKINPTNNE